MHGLESALNDDEFVERIKAVILTSFRPFSYSDNPFRFKLLDYLKKKSNLKQDAFIMGNYFQLDPIYQGCIELMRKSKSYNAEVCINESTYYNVSKNKLELINGSYEYNNSYNYIDLFYLLKDSNDMYHMNINKPHL